MSVLYVILPLALVLGAAFLAAFLWAVRGGQFDDVETPALRVILEDRPAGGPSDRTEEDPEPKEESEAGR